ncbi:hypothetical protein HDV05_002498, partial [Chytridiales sp. JEL 0842]
MWDLMPREIRHRILNFSDPLTQYLNIHGPYGSLQSSTPANIIAKKAYELGS